MAKGSSQLRDTSKGRDDAPCPTNGTAYLMILNAVRQSHGLIHGRLTDASGEHCAIGHFFHVNKGVCLNGSLIDEVAMVNDSMPTATPRHVARKTVERLDSFIAAVAHKRLTYERLTA